MLSNFDSLDLAGDASRAGETCSLTHYVRVSVTTVTYNALLSMHVNTINA